MKRHIFHLLVLGMVLALLLAPGSDRGATAHGMAALAQAGSSSAPLIQPTPTHAENGEPLELDFDTVLNVPDELRPPIAEAMTSGITRLTHNRFTVSALRTSGDWMHAVLVPTYVVEAGWEVELRPAEIMEVLGQRSAAGEFSAYLRGTGDFAALTREVPQDFIDFSPPREPASALVNYLFPWTSGQNWYKSQGWHQGNAIDFSPVTRGTRPIHDAVLAAASGRLTEVCNDGYQSMLQIEHADGNTQYLHLDVNEIRRDLLGQQVSRGQFLGLLYDGSQGSCWRDGRYYRYCTSCGYGTGAHVHFVLPRRNMTIDGHNANNVANSANATTYRSSNQRSDGDGTTPNCADGEGVILYEHPGYGGRCTRFTSDDGSIGNRPIGNDTASSIRVIGNYEATVCEHDNYTGACSTFTGDDPEFHNDAIGNDRASSIRVRRRDAGGDSNCDGGPGVYLYEHSSYNGRCSKFTGDASHPRNWYIGNDTASSIRFVGNYEAKVCEHDDYRGTCSTFTEDDPDFGNDAIGHDRASSLQVRERSGGSSNCDGGQGVYLYEHAWYDGRCSKFTGDSPNPRDWYIGNDTASSIRFFGNYEARVCEHDNYHGSCSTFTGDDPEFHNNAIGNDRASSIRVRQRSSGPTSCPNDQFLTEYFSIRNPVGSPDFRRCESRIDADWAYDGPGHGIGGDNFSIRWSGDFWFDPGRYRFRTRTDDGVRFGIDGRRLINEWRDMGATTFTVDRTLSAGLHTLRMEYHEHGGYATARLSWERLTSEDDPDDGRTIGYGQGINGTVDPARDRDDYYFDGSAGQAITIRMDKRNSDLDTYIELYNPDGTLLDQDDDGGVGLNSRLSTTLQQNGRHKIIARGYYYRSTGGYRLNLSRESTSDPDDDRWIAFGSTLISTISPEDDRDWYYFSATGGRTVSIRMNQIFSDLDSFLELYDDSGNRIARNDDGGGYPNSHLVYTLPRSGVYRIMARSYALSSSGWYSLRLDLAGNTNLASEQGAWATSTAVNGAEPHQALDGDLATAWSAQADEPQFIQIDLGATTAFDQVVLRWGSAYGQSYGLFYQADGEWRNVYWTDAGDGGNDVVPLAPAQARYVGLYLTQPGTSGGYSLLEFEVYNTEDKVIPIILPDDKPPEQGVEQVVPPPPNEPGKDTILIGEGPTAQENTPVAGITEIETLDIEVHNSRPTAHILYPIPDAPPGGAQDLILFQGVASDNDEAGQAIVAYEWRSDQDGPLGAQQVFTTTRAALSPGPHVISFRAQDDEGDWSDWAQVTIQVTHTPCYDFVEPSPVGVEDVQAAADRWRRRADEAGWDARFDLDGDQVIDIADIMRIAAAWGSACE